MFLRSDALWTGLRGRFYSVPVVASQRSGEVIGGKEKAAADSPPQAEYLADPNTFLL